MPGETTSSAMREMEIRTTLYSAGLFLTGSCVEIVEISTGGDGLSPFSVITKAAAVCYVLGARFATHTAEYIESIEGSVPQEWYET